MATSSGKQGNPAQIAGDPRETAPQPEFPKQDMDWPGQEHKMTPKPDFGYDTYRGSGKLKDKVAVITGSDSGIGRAVALAYAREGADVVIAYLNEHEDAKETQRVVEEAGRRALLAPGDITKEETLQMIVDKATKEFGRIDILVNNAADQHDAVDFMEVSRERLERTFNTNIIAMMRLCQLALPHMPDGSAIINVASIQAYKPSPNILDYASTKGAIVAFTKGLAQDLIKKRGIRVNAVAPGPVWTPLIVESFPEEKVKEFGKKNSPAERPAQPRELAPAFVFLASNADSSYVAGEILAVTGGSPNVS